MAIGRSFRGRTQLFLDKPIHLKKRINHLILGPKLGDGEGYTLVPRQAHGEGVHLPPDAVEDDDPGPEGADLHGDHRRPTSADADEDEGPLAGGSEDSVEL